MQSKVMAVEFISKMDRLIVLESFEGDMEFEISLLV